MDNKDENQNKKSIIDIIESINNNIIFKIPNKVLK